MNKTPKLRFKEFSGDWEIKKAKELFESISDKNHNGDLEVLSATQDRGVIPRSELNIDIKFEQSNLTSYKRVKESDFIISLRSFQGGIEHSHYMGLVSPAYTVFNFKNNLDLNHNFFGEIFKMQNFINRLNTLTYGIRDGKAISFKDFSDVKLSFPTKEEQEKIASFFSLIDDKISLQGEKVEALKDYKRGMMQKIFSRTLRFKDDNGRDYPEWEEKKLGQITKVTDGVHFTPNYVDYGIPFWSVETIVSNSNPKYITEDAHKEAIKRCYPKKGDILLTRIGTLAKPKLVDWDEEFSLYVSVALIKSSQEYNSKFARYYFESEDYQKEFFSKSLLTATPKKINMEDLKQTKIKLPSLKEQEKIGQFLDLIENKLKREQEKLDYLNEYKKGLLQQIFV